MPISFNKKSGLFTITTKNTKYEFSVINDRYLVHQFYGKKNAKYEPYKPYVVSFSPYRKDTGNNWSPDIFPSEFSFFGSGDFRTSALKLRGADGSCVTDFKYKKYKIFSGRPDLGALPASRADEKTKSLCIVLEDEVTGCILNLYYTSFYDEDVIARSIRIENRGDHDVKIEKCMSMTLDLPSCSFDMISLYGGHYRERQYQRVPVHHGMQSVYSRRGASSPQYNPFFALCSHKAGEDSGEVWGFNFVWSGSFIDEVEVDQTNCTRVQIGLGEENFGYTVERGGSFTSPEAVMTYSSAGLGRMTRNFHNFIRRRILLERSVSRPHPVVLNTWEACYFDIDEEKLVKFAEESASVGFDMLVMDDGWFGKRYSDWSALGDWYPNPEKFKDGLKSFAERVKAKGVDFGIWIEPEMVNPDSDLYRAHPEWALSVPGREPHESRQQLVLDMANREVVEYLKRTFKEAFDGVPIDYFKWDFNRHLSDVYSRALPADRQDEVMFRFVLGTYDLLRWFEKEYPNAPIETCSGGGGRYDLGMMSFGFQIWASDNTDPYWRTLIQRTALIAYPAATMSCHVSNPRGDLRSLDFRYKVACGGMLGYELNFLEAGDDVKAEMSRQVKEYKTFEHLIREGDYFSIVSPTTDSYSSYYYASADRSEILFSLIEKADTEKGVTKKLRIKEADKNARYTDVLTGKEYSGRELKEGIALNLTGEKDTALIRYYVRAQDKS